VAFESFSLVHGKNKRRGIASPLIVMLSVCIATIAVPIVAFLSDLHLHRLSLICRDISDVIDSQMIENQLICGDGRTRTAVQTSLQAAFYTLILPLFFDRGLPEGGRTLAYPLCLGGV